MQLVRPLTRLLRAPPPAGVASAARPGPPDTAAAAAAAADEEDAQRAAAVRNLPDGETLRSLAGLPGMSSAVPPGTAQAARERLAQLIDGGMLDLSALCASAPDPVALAAVAALCADPGRLTQALASLGADDIGRLVTDGSSSRIRQIAAQGIEDPAQLRLLLKRVQGRDKSVYKIIKQKCDLLRAEEQRVAQIERDIESLGAALERHARRVYDVLYAPSLRQFEAQWRDLEALAAPEAAERVRLGLDRCREVIEQQARRLAEQAERAAQEAALRAEREAADAQAAAQARLRDETEALAAAEAARERDAAEQARAASLAADALALREIGVLIGKAHGALRDGNTGRAAGLRRAIEEKLPALPAIPAQLAGQMQHLDAKLHELKEWKDYAVAPKRAELIAEMEALVGSGEEPAALATRIQSLRDQWKTISKGIVIESEADWQRFNQAAAAAYQPCRDYFEAQARLRQENLDKRKALLERFRAFESAQSAEHPDWRAVATVLREARLEWRRIFPVDRAAGRLLQEEFDAAIGGLQARLDAWYAQNVAEKQALIERVRQLVAAPDGREAVEAVKRLQLRWKETGTVSREQEQPLWEAFREQCDAVFQRRQQAYTEYTAALEAARVRAVALCAEAERLAGLTGTALREGMAQVPQWRAAFEALGELPRADERKLHDRFERSLTLCKTRLSQEQARDKERAVGQLLESGRRIQAYGWAVAADLAPVERDALKQGAESFIAGVGQWPKGASEALQAAWALAHATAAADAASHETALRMLCIRGEIFAELPTPPEDQPLRREYQVRRLVQHMGERSETRPDELDALALEWVRVGAVPPSVHEALLARFLRCR